MNAGLIAAMVLLQSTTQRNLDRKKAKPEIEIRKPAKSYTNVCLHQPKTYCNCKGECEGNGDYYE